MPDADSPNRLLELVSDRVGIIKSLTFPTRGADEPNPPLICQATLSHFDFRNVEPSQRIAAGKGLTEREAMAGAIGEAVEHYCAAHFDKRRTRLAAWAAISNNAISPLDFVLYSPVQYASSDFKYHRWSPNDEVTWMEARELPDGNPVFVCSTLIYLVDRMMRPEDFLCPTTSNGLACGPNVETAVLNGLYELIERDGFLLHWMNRLPAPEVNFPEGAGPAASIRSHYRRFGVEVRVFNVTTDLPAYVMMAVALARDANAPAALVGLGCHLDPGIALLKALMEICQIRPGHLQRWRKASPAGRLRVYQDVHTLDDHSDFAGLPERIGEFDFLLANGRRQDLEDLPARTTGSLMGDLEACVSNLNHLNYRVLYADLTTPDVACYGLRVVRVLATGLQPMHFGYGEERLGGRRLFEVAWRMRISPAPRTEEDLNPCPHPLA